MPSLGQYVDEFVVPVKKARIDEYRRFSERAGRVWMEKGALQYIECVGDDVPMGKLTSFPRAVHLEDDEVAVFAWIVYPLREDRDRINNAVMTDPRLEQDMKNMPLDGKRMIYGGFKVFVSL
jgi:uncharacterized protein YbaA (DUF1428 family)